MLEVKNLKKSHGSKVTLHDISFTIGRGQIALFLGGSGVGKSTLLRVLNNLETYDSGELLLDGEPLDHVDHGVGMVFQHFNLFENLSVVENITLALRKVQGKTPKEADVIAHELLVRYGLADKANKSVQTLSGGQKQRLAIARTLALDPKIVCLDEPTSALDPLKTRHVARDIEAIAKDNRIVLLSTHDVQLVGQLEAIIFLMEDGRIVESCKTSQYSDSPESYPHLVRFLGGGV